MSVASASYLSANATITAGLPNFSTYYNIIVTTHGQIQVAQVQQEADKSGNTNNKKQLKATLITDTSDIIRKTVAFAMNTNNTALFTLVNYSDSDLTKASDTKLIGICQVVHDKANANVIAMESYGVTAALITTLQDEITDFSNAIPKGRVDKADSGGATKLLVTLFKTLVTNWAKIDTLVEMVKVTQPVFYNEYISVRTVIDTGASSLSLKIKAQDAESGEGIANVSLSISPANGQMKAMSVQSKKADVKKTASGGSAHYKSLADGDYVVTATKPGFKDVTATISVVNGESTVLEIPMEKA